MHNGAAEKAWASPWCHFVRSTVELLQGFALHPQLHLGILLEDLRVALAEQLRYRCPLVDGGRETPVASHGLDGSTVAGNLWSADHFFGAATNQASESESVNTRAFVGTNPTGELINSGLPMVADDVIDTNHHGQPKLHART